jgi:hypothetical protein
MCYISNLTCACTWKLGHRWENIRTKHRHCRKEVHRYNFIMYLQRVDDRKECRKHCGIQFSDSPYEFE